MGLSDIFLVFSRQLASFSRLIHFKLGRETLQLEVSNLCLFFSSTPLALLNKVSKRKAPTLTVEDDPLSTLADVQFGLAFPSELASAPMMSKANAAKEGGESTTAPASQTSKNPRLITRQRERHAYSRARGMQCVEESLRLRPSFLSLLGVRPLFPALFKEHGHGSAPSVDGDRSN